MNEPMQQLAVWASGMVEFFGDLDVPDGAIIVCTAFGDQAVAALFEAVKEASVLHDFGGRMALRVPEIDPDRDEATGVDPAVEALIDWGDSLSGELAEERIIWERAHAR